LVEMSEAEIKEFGKDIGLTAGEIFSTLKFMRSTVESEGEGSLLPPGDSVSNNSAGGATTNESQGEGVARGEQERNETLPLGAGGDTTNESPPRGRGSKVHPVPSARFDPSQNTTLAAAAPAEPPSTPWKAEQERNESLQPGAGGDTTNESPGEEVAGYNPYAGQPARQDRRPSGAVEAYLAKCETKIMHCAMLIMIVSAEFDCIGFVLMSTTIWGYENELLKLLYMAMPFGYVVAIMMYYYERRKAKRARALEEGPKPKTTRLLDEYVYMPYHYTPLLRFYMLIKPKTKEDVMCLFNVNALSSFTLGVAQLLGVFFTFVQNEEVTIDVQIAVIGQVLSWIVTIFHFLGYSLHIGKAEEVATRRVRLLEKFSEDNERMKEAVEAVQKRIRGRERASVKDELKALEERYRQAALWGLEQYAEYGFSVDPKAEWQDVSEKVLQTHTAQLEIFIKDIDFNDMENESDLVRDTGDLFSSEEIDAPRYDKMVMERLTSLSSKALKFAMLSMIVSAEFDFLGYLMMLRTVWAYEIVILRVLYIAMPCGYLCAVLWHYWEDRQGATEQTGFKLEYSIGHFCPGLRAYMLLKSKTKNDIMCLFSVNSLSSFTLGFAQIFGILYTLIEKHPINLDVRIAIAGQILSWTITLVHVLGYSLDIGKAEELHTRYVKLSIRRDNYWEELTSCVDEVVSINRAEHYPSKLKDLKQAEDKLTASRRATVEHLKQLHPLVQQEVEDLPLEKLMMLLMRTYMSQMRIFVEDIVEKNVPQDKTGARSVSVRPNDPENAANDLAEGISGKLTLLGESYTEMTGEGMFANQSKVRKEIHSTTNKVLKFLMLMMIISAEFDFFGFCLMFATIWSYGDDEYNITLITGNADGFMLLNNAGSPKLTYTPTYTPHFNVDIKEGEDVTILRVIYILMACGYVIAVLVYRYMKRREEQKKVQDGVAGGQLRLYNLDPPHYTPLLRCYMLLKSKDRNDVLCLFMVNALSSFTFGFAQIIGVIYTVILDKPFNLDVQLAIAGQVLSWLVTISFFLGYALPIGLAEELHTRYMELGITRDKMWEIITGLVQDYSDLIVSGTPKDVQAAKEAIAREKEAWIVPIIHNNPRMSQRDLESLPLEWLMKIAMKTHVSQLTRFVQGLQKAR